MSIHHTRAPSVFSPQRVKALCLFWFLLLASTLLWDASGLDLVVMQQIGTPQGFPLRHNWWLEQVLHTGLRRVITVLYLMLWAWACWPLRDRPGLGLGLPRRERVTAMALVTLALAYISTLKHLSLTSCPWELRIFGGAALQVSHWNWGQADGGPGHCFPGGHVSSAFAFVVLALPWLLPPGGGQRSANVGLFLMAGILMTGLVAGAAQTLRGAHHPSHTLWTLLICSAIGGLGWLAGSGLFDSRQTQMHPRDSGPA